MFCQQCGTQIPEEARYCSGCGSSLGPATATAKRADERPAPRTFSLGVKILVFCFCAVVAIIGVTLSVRNQPKSVSNEPNRVHVNNNVVAANARKVAPPTRKWTLVTGQSSFDDSETIELKLTAEKPISGWPAKITMPVLVLRCQEHKTEAYVRTGMAHTVEYGRHGKATVRIRFDHDSPATVETSESTNNEGLFFEEPISLIRSMLKHEQSDLWLYAIQFIAGGNRL